MKNAVLCLTLLVIALAPLNIAQACIENFQWSPQRFWSIHSQLELIQESMSTTPAQLYEKHYKDIKTREDKYTEKEKLAMQELLTGDIQKALTLFLDLENSNREYASAANLGTAYELNGDNQNALKWIKEGVKRNPNSHHKTEWLHVLILEAKINLEKNPDYYNGKRVLELAGTLPEKESDVFFTYNGQNFNRFDVEMALAYQLFERTVFVKPEDPVVADLLYSLARITAHKKDLVTASAFLDISREYGFSDTRLLEETQHDYKHQIFMQKVTPIFTKVGLVLLIWSLLVFITLKAYKKKPTTETEKA